MSTFFVSGTDTDAGKTFVSTALLAAAQVKGLSTAAVKPVAAGAAATETGLRNDDALALQAAMTMSLPYEQINPVCFEPAIAPHIAAAQLNKHVTASRLSGFCRGVMMKGADLTLIEGAGGWRVPLNPRENLSHLVQELKVPVILVVGMRLGCINHALLSAEAIVNDGLQIAGWVANRIDPNMACYEENLATLKARLPFACLGEVPWMPDAEPIEAAAFLDIGKMLKA